MLHIKSSFHNIPFKYTFFYDSIFVIHQGKFRWLCMPMSTTQVPAHFQYIMENIPFWESGSCSWPAVIFLDGIVVYGDTQKKALDGILEAIKCLASAGCMLNICKSQLLQSEVQVHQYHWAFDGFWPPIVTKLTSLMEQMNSELAQIN